MTECYLEPETIALLLEKCMALLTGYALALKATAAAGLLSAELSREVSSQHVRRVVDAVQDDRCQVVLHNCGNRGQVTEEMVETGAFGLHFGNQADLVEALRTVPTDRLVLGNLDPAGLLKLGTADEMARATSALLHGTASFPNSVLSTGCDTPPRVPLVNIDAFFGALEIFNRGRAA
jgi:uroporphyrinogen decarboxylase